MIIVHLNGLYNRNYSLEFHNLSGPHHIRPLPQVVHPTSPSAIEITRYSCSPSPLDLEKIEIAIDQLPELPPACHSSVTMDDILQKESNNSSRLKVETKREESVIEQPLSPLSYLFDFINYASLILSNKLSILFHPIIVWPCGWYYKVQEWAYV